MTQPTLKLNTYKWKILTPTGFESFEGVSYNGDKRVLTISFTDGTTIGVTPDHKLFKRCSIILAKSVKPGMILDGVPKSKQVVSVTTGTVVPVFDIVHTPSHTFIANDITNHNCEMLSSDPLLIDSMKAAQLKTHEHKSQELGVKIWKDFEKQEQTKYQQSTSQQVQNYNLHNQWHNPSRHEQVETKVYDKQCIVTVDPSKGVERDFTVVQVFSYPGLEQMMELRSNKSKTGDIYIALKRIWEKADKAGWQVYFTVENNGVGEGILALFANDEALPENVELVSEVGQIGLNTSAKSKALGCKIFKEFVEGGVLKLNSRDLVHEIKNFILTGGTYKAKEGSTDDCVMATILTCRVVKQLAAYDETAFDMLYSVNESEESKHEFDDTDSDDYDEMPMIF